uniref:Gag1-like clamp domain-containing protein n=1 Tax=Noccaea caerulescens TaxID=107243 RepID=A0A1J3HNG5_NOCCA
MELFTANCLATDDKPLELSKLVIEEKCSVEKNTESNLALVNHGEKLWQENREKWVGDQSRQRKKPTKDQIISWSTTYEDLLSTHEPFTESIPLPEMVDFLVDIWYDEGLYD